MILAPHEITSQLNQAFTKYGSDKATKHHYHLIYEAEFNSIRKQPLAILEVGIFKGESTAAWVEYFPNAKIYGLDVFTRVPINQIAILNHPRVSAVRGDSTDVTVIEQIHKKWPGIKFDIIIDDGLHAPRANADTFGNLINLLKDDGAYFIEDVWPLDEMNSEDMKNPWVINHSNELNIFEMNYFLNKVKDYKMERFDLRMVSKHPDSYIIKIVK